MTSSAPSPQISVEGITLDWLMRLRWVAVLGQVITLGVVHFYLQIKLPWLPLGLITVLLALSNLALQHWRHKAKRITDAFLAGVLFFDACLLTALLYFSGGIWNPFCTFFLVHITMAAVILRGIPLALILLTCLSGFTFLFFYHVPLHMPHTHAGTITFSWHLRGLLTAFILTAFCLTYFINRLNSHLHRANQELAASRLLAAQHERFAGLATLAAGMAHELGTPLGTIAVVSNDLARNVHSMERPQVAADAEVIRAEVTRCHQILEKLSHHITTGETELETEIETRTFMLNVLEKFPAAQKRIKAEWTVATLRLPLESVTQAVAVLIKNGLDASAHEQVVHVRVESQAQTISFRIQDEGRGITPEHLEKIGEPFFTTKNVGEGMGLGLFLVRTMAERVGGYLKIQSQPGRGTEAVLSLPIKRKACP